MALNFPNRMRFYETARCAVRFWGHDGAMESSFFVAADLLKQLQPAMWFNENSVRSQSRGDPVGRKQSLRARPQVLIPPGRRRLLNRAVAGGWRRCIRGFDGPAVPMSRQSEKLNGRCNARHGAEGTR
jgi:Protein of unknown function (DUF1488)